MARFSMSAKIVCLLTLAVLAPACTKKDSNNFFAALTSGTIAFDSATFTVSEGGGTATITITRTGGSQGAVAVVFSTIPGGSAASPADYTDVIGSIVSWAAGDTANKTVQIPISQDVLVEGDETVELALALSAGGASLGLDRATLTIQDDDAPAAGVIQLEVSAASISEDGGSITITATRTGGTTGAVSATYATSDNTATAGADYTSTAGTFNWAAGDATPQSIAVPILEDAAAEGDEDFDFDLTGAGGGAVLGSIQSTVVTIVDNDSTGSIQLASGVFFVSESGVQATVTVTRTGGSQGAASVNFATSNNSATEPDDYTASSGTLSWADGDFADKSFTVEITDDSLLEGNEDIDLTLSGVTGATLGAPNTGVLTILDDDSTLEFSPATFNQVENGITATITVIRNGDTTLPVSVDFATSNGTALAPGDYAANSGTLNWPAGDGAAKTFDVTIVDDILLEGDETVNLTLTNAAGVGAALGAQDTAVLTILDNPGSVQFELVAYSVNEAGVTATITATRTEGSGGVVTVDYGVNGGAPGTAATPDDFTLAGTGTLTWPDQDATNQTFDVNIVNDTIVEGDETVGLLLTNPTGGVAIGTPAATVLTIVDNDIEVQFDQPTYTMDENGAAITITATRVGTTVGQVTVTWSHTDVTATEGVGGDYTAAGGVLTWADGDATPQTFQVAPIDDFLLEGGETFDLDLTGPAATLGSQVALGAPATTTVTIVDDDVPGTLQFQTVASSGQEGNLVNLIATRTAGSGGMVTVDYNFTGGTALPGDYTDGGTGTLTWGPGDTANKLIPITLIADTSSEGSENLIVTLSGETGGATLGANSVHDLTIIDEAGSLEFISATFNEQEDNTAPVPGVITVSRSGGRGGAVDVNFSVAAGGTATGGGIDFTITNGTLSWPDDVDGNMTFPVTVAADGTIEVLETVNLALAGPTNGAVLGTQSTAVLNITDSPGELNFTLGTFNVQEPNTGTIQALVTVSRTVGSGGVVGASLNDVGSGSATSGVDYGAIGGVAPVSFPDGNTTNQSFMVDILADGTIEVTKDVDLSLVTPTGGVTIGATNTTTLNIQDSPGLLTLSSPTYTVGETDLSLLVTLQRTGGSGGVLECTVNSTPGTAVAPDDYGETVGLVRQWADGDNANKTFTVTIVDDALTEGDENFTLDLSNLTGGAGAGPNQSATVTITDSPGTLQFQVTSITGNGEGAVVAINATRTGGSGGAVTATYAFNPTASTAVPADFIDGGTGTLSWPNGNTSVQSFNLTLVDDTTVDVPIELVAMDLTGTTGGAVLGANAQVVVEIVENDSGVQFTGANFGGTEGGNAFITLSRTGSIADPITVDFSQTSGVAADPADYSPSPFPTVSWGAGDGANKTITVSLAADGSSEGPETAVFTLNTPLPAPTVFIGAQASTTLTITDEPGTLVFSAPNYNVTEGTATVQITVNRINGRGGSVGATVSTSNGSAVEPGDYTLTSQLVSFSDDSTTPEVINIPITDDSTGEFVELFNVGLSAPTGGVSLGAGSTVTITDDDVSVEFISATYQGGEPNAVITVEVRRVGTTSGAIDVNWNLANVTATGPGGAPNDYDTVGSATFGTLSWPDAVGGNQSFDITVIDDVLAEGTEFINLFLDTPVNCTLGPQSTAVVNILDDEQTVQFTQATYSFVEGAGAVTGTVSRTGDFTGTLTVEVSDLLTGNASVGNDYTMATPQVLSWNNGEGGTKTFAITILEDVLLELGPPELVDLQLGSLGGTAVASLGTPSTAQVEITDNDARIEFTSATYNGAEGSGSVIVTATRTGDTSGSATVQFGLDGPPGTATDGVDYTFTPGTLTFNPTDVNRTFTVDIIDDGEAEADPETVNLLLFNLTGANHAFGTQTTSTVEIAENDVAVEFTSATYNVDENVGGGLATITVRRVGSLTGQVDVDVETLTSGTATPSPNPDFDFTVTTQGLTWPAGVGGNQSFQFPITDDVLLDPSETVDIEIVALSLTGTGTPTPPIVGPQGTAVVTIVDDDVPGTLQFQLAGSNIGEGGGIINVNVDRVAGSGGTVDVDFSATGGTTAANPADFTFITASPLTWGPGDTTTKIIQVQINQDAEAEVPEFIEITLSNPTNGAVLGAPFVHNVQIDDDDTGFRFTTATQDVSESAGTVTVFVERIGSTVGAVQVDIVDLGTGTADSTPGPDQDYQTWTPFTLNWPNGVGGTMQFQFNIFDDGTTEIPDETIILELQSNMPGSTTIEAPSQQTVTILDNDGPSITHMNPFPTSTNRNPLENVWMRFSEPMVIGTVTPVFASSSGGTLPVIVGVFWNAANTELTVAFDMDGDGFYTPNDRLELGADYELTINATATGQTTGLQMGSPFVIDFSVMPDNTGPTLVSIESAIGGVGTGQDPRTTVLTGAVDGFLLEFTDPSGINTAGWLQAWVSNSSNEWFDSIENPDPQVDDGEFGPDGMIIRWIGVTATDATLEIEFTGGPLPAGELHCVDVGWIQDMLFNNLQMDEFAAVTAGTEAVNVAPTISGTAPFDGQTNVPLESGALLGLSEPVSPNVVNLVTVVGSVSGDITGSVEFFYDGYAEGVGIEPLVAWPNNETITVTLAAGVVDPAGNASAAPQGFSFTTENDPVAHGFEVDVDFSTLKYNNSVSTQPNVSQWNWGGSTKFRETVSQNRAYVDIAAIPEGAITIHELDSGAPFKGWELDARDPGDFQFRSINGVGIEGDLAYVLSLNASLPSTRGGALVPITHEFRTVGPPMGYRLTFPFPGPVTWSNNARPTLWQAPWSAFGTAGGGSILEVDWGGSNDDTFTQNPNPFQSDPPENVMLSFTNTPDALLQIGGSQPFVHVTNGGNPNNFNGFYETPDGFVEIAGTPGFHTLTATVSDSDVANTWTVSRRGYVFASTPTATVNTGFPFSPTAPRYEWTGIDAAAEAILIEIEEDFGGGNTQTVHTWLVSRGAGGVPQANGNFVHPADHPLNGGTDYIFTIIMFKSEDDNLGEEAGFGIGEDTWTTP